MPHTIIAGHVELGLEGFELRIDRIGSERYFISIVLDGASNAKEQMRERGRVVCLGKDTEATRSLSIAEARSFERGNDLGLPVPDSDTASLINLPRARRLTATKDSEGT